jgi:hypothetical protein
MMRRSPLCKQSWEFVLSLLPGRQVKPSPLGRLSTKSWKVQAILLKLILSKREKALLILGLCRRRNRVFFQKLGFCFYG